MIQNAVNRRNFLSAMALLSAGAISGTAASGQNLLNAAAGDVEAAWTSFAEQMATETSPWTPEVSAVSIAVAGHTHRAGTPVMFKNIGLVALPVFVFWGDSRHPNDVQVHLFNNSTFKRMGCWNIFELEAFNSLCHRGSGQQVQQFVSEIVSQGRIPINPLVQVQPMVAESRQVNIRVATSTQTFHTKKLLV